MLECVLDKFAALERPLNRAMVPVRAAAGAVVFAAVVVLDPFVVRGPMSTWRHMRLPEGLSTLMPWLIVGAVIAAGVVAVLKAVLRPSGTAFVGVSSTALSFLEGLAALVGGILPFLGALLVAFLLLPSTLLISREEAKGQEVWGAAHPRGLTLLLVLFRV